MTPDQIDLQISELESRLERLRVLYEQYFMGFERTEPAIPHKDVERRVYELRKTRFPTTAKRFKFQTITQRYTSLVQYWTRTCREIENGTYRKHRIKARKRFASESSRPDAMSPQERAEAAAQAKEATGADLADLMDSEMDLNAEMSSVLSALDAMPTGGRSLAALGPSLASPAIGSARKGALNLSLPNIKVKEQATDSAEGRGAQPSGLAPLQIRASAMPSSLKKSLAPAPAPASSGLSPRQQAEALQKKAQELLQKKQPESPPAKSPPKSKYPVAPGSKFPLAPGPKISSAAAASSPKAPPPRSLAAPVAKAPAPIPAPSAKSASTLSDDRIRALHQSYCDARTQTNARTVSLEKLSQSIRETEAKIRAQNKGRAVDFEVTIQGGKAILKPQLK